jgi:hypothetical protein
MNASRDLIQTAKQPFNLIEVGELLILCIVCGVLGFMVLLALITNTFGLESSSVLYLFETDGAAAVRQLQLNISRNELNPWGHYNYGNIYNSITFIFLKFALFLDYDVLQTQFIGYAMKTLALLAYLVTLLLCYVLFRKFSITPALRAIFVLLLASLPVHYSHIFLIHPDNLALCFIVAAMLMITLRQDSFGLVLGAIFSGFAFGTKYTGVFLLPFLPLPYIYTLLQQGQTWSKTIANIVKAGLLAVCVFLTIWFVTNPMALMNYRDLLQDIAYERQRLTQVQGSALSTNPFRWFSVILQQFSLSGSIVLLGGLFGGVFALLSALRQNRNRLRDLLTLRTFCSRRSALIAVVTSYTMIIFLYFFFAISYRKLKYMLHIVPGMLLLSAIGMQWLYNRLASQYARLTVSFLLLGLTLTLSVHAMREQSVLSTKPHNDYLVAGQWLARSFPPTTRILYERHGYIPQWYFLNFQISDYITEKALNAFQPDLVMLNQHTYGQWSGRRRETTKEGSSYRMSPYFLPKEDASVAFRQRLCAPENSSWQIVYESDSLIILQRRLEHL